MHRSQRLLLLALTATALLGSSASSRAAAGPPSLGATVALTPRDPAALAAYATAVTTPGSLRYHRYLTVSQFARRFGAGPAAIAKVRSALATQGLSTGAVSANGLEIPVTGSAAVISNDVSMSRGRFRVSLSMSAGIAGVVQGIIGSDTSAPTSKVIVHRSPTSALDVRARTAPSDTVTAPAPADTAGPQPCADAVAAAAGGTGYTANQIASDYGLSNYYAAGDEGAKVTVAVYELEPFSASDIAAYQSCYGTNADVTTVRVDGGAGGGAGTGEAAMDVETLIGLAPRASIKVYEGPPTGLGAYDTYSRIIGDNSAQVISISWGQCEALKGSIPAAAENTLFQEAAVQGQSVLVSAGDRGSNDCGNHQQSVDDPAGQPWVTAVAATSHLPSGDVVWNDSLGATGGGVSRLWGRPAYQNATARPQSAISCGAFGHACREVPDVSVDGDPATGYVAYYLGAWQTVGGSSVAAPAVAALTALADASPACAGHSIGFLNPKLYRAAGANYAANFHDVTLGDNSFDSVAGFAAGPGYDMVSGLGTPAPSLGQTLCDQTNTLTLTPSSYGRGPVAVKATGTVRLRRPRNRFGGVGVRVHFRLTAEDLRGLKLTFTATGLPRGLRIDRRTGLISGRPEAVESKTVRVRAADNRGGAVTIVFRWTINRPRHGA